MGNMVTRIIMVNIGVFLAMSITHLIIFFVAGNPAVQQEWFHQLTGWFAIPVEPVQILFRPWTIVTYMFLHTGFWHILWNMLFLFWFGRILHQFLGNRKILPIYFYGGLVGAALAILLQNISPTLQEFAPAEYMLGASAGVMAIVVAAAATAPNYTMFLLLLGPVKLKYIALVVVLLDVIAIPSLSNTGGHIAHLGGAILGLMFIRQLQRGRDWSVGFNRVFEALEALFARRRRPRVVYRRQQRETNFSKGRSSRYAKDKQQQLDEILDKIAKSGYENLSKEEKEFLFRVSKEE